jgi:hypothetical protein
MHLKERDKTLIKGHEGNTVRKGGGGKKGSFRNKKRKMIHQPHNIRRATSSQ